MKDAPPQIGIIHWVDASCHGTDIFNRSDKFELVEGYACGLVIAEDDDKITLAMDWFNEVDTVRNVSTYPKTGIKEIIKHPLGEWQVKEMKEIKDGQR